MSDTVTRIRERQQHRHRRRIPRERREDDRLTGFALQRAESYAALRIFLGDRRAFKILAGITAIAILLWFAGVLLG